MTSIAAFYIAGMLMVFLHAIMRYTESWRYWYSSYQLTKDDAVAHRLVSDVGFHLVTMLLWPVVLVAYLIKHHQKPVVNLIQASVRHSAVIKQNSLEDRAGGLSMVEKDND